METKSIINMLYNEADCYSEKILPKDKNYRKYCAIAGNREQDLMNLLTEEQWKTFEEYVDAVTMHGDIYNEETFRQGVSLGIRITAEAFLLCE